MSSFSVCSGLFIQGTCNYISSEWIQPKLALGGDDYSMCYNATIRLRMYFMLPGKKIFISAYHPFKALESMVIAGGHYFRISINARQIEMVPEGNDCLNIGKNMTEVFDSYDDYETWYKL